MGFINESDPISGKSAKAFATIDGRVEELFYAVKLDSGMEKIKADVPILGKSVTGQRATGWKGTGTLTVYYITSVFRQLMRKYVKTNEDFYFDLQVINEDPTSRAGKQTSVLKGCNIDRVTAAAFDIESDGPLQEEIPFTFSDYDLLDQFTTLQ